MSATLLLVARDGVTALAAQLCAIAALPDKATVVIVDDAARPEVSALLGELEGVILISSERPLGRRAALALAARHAPDDVCIALSPQARPVAGSIARLVAAVEAGARLAAPVIETAAGDVYGYAAGADGSLLPLREAGPFDALPLDCLAAARGFWSELAPTWAPLAGPHETAFTAAARAQGDVVVVAGARCVRASVGPPISVAICTRDRADELAPCVEALVAHGATADGCEVLIVDNGSSDGTPQLAAALAERHRGVRVVHEATAGLCQAREAGAAAAHAPVVVYIDDDARPGPGWVEALRDAFADDDVVIAGGPIVGLWPDGRREAWPPAGREVFLGVLDLGDADQEPELPEHGPWGGNFAVRTAALQAIGGFDERFGAGARGWLGGDEVYVNHLIRRAGLGRVRFIAHAAVGHRCEKSRCTDSYLVLRAYRAGAESVQLALALGLGPQLRPRIAASSSAALAAIAPRRARLDVDGLLGLIDAAPAPVDGRIDLAFALGRLAAAGGDSRPALVPLAHGASLAIAPANAWGGGRPAVPPRAPTSAVLPQRPVTGDRLAPVLFVFPELPSPRLSSGHRRAFEMLLSLARLGCSPTLWCRSLVDDADALGALYEAGVDVRSLERGDGIADLARETRFAAAIVSFWYEARAVLPALRAASPPTLAVVDSVDVHFVRETREAELRGDEPALAAAARTRTHELAVYRSADAVIAVTDVEQELLGGLLPGMPVGVVPNVHRIAGPAVPKGRDGCVFVGGFRHPPNLDAALFLCDAVLPALRARGYDGSVAIAGSAMPDALAAHARAAGAEVLGFVESMESVLAGRRVSLAPLRAGAGLKGKVGEALAQGVPVVGTTIAAEGFERPGDGMLVVDDAPGIAAAVVRLTSDDALWQRLSDGGRALVARTLGPDRCDRELGELVEYLATHQQAQAS